MNAGTGTDEDLRATRARARQAQARSIGLSAFVYAYPLIEALRTCRLQTCGGGGAAPRAPINQLFHLDGPSTSADRDIVTPANDLLYTTAWIDLRAGPVLLTVPAADSDPSRYFVLALYDAYTENFENLGPANCRPAGETVMLLGPEQTATAPGDGTRVVRCPTNLVWLIARILVVDEADLPAARQLQAQIALTSPQGKLSSTPPEAIAQWQGEPVDVMAEEWVDGHDPTGVVPRFFRHVCLGLAEAPGRIEDRGLVAWFASIGLTGGATFSWTALDQATQQGLIEGFHEAVALIGTAARSRAARPWVLASRAGRYGSDYLTRALTAYIGLGALATDEAIYGAGHFDRGGELLDGRGRYQLRFAADDQPPAQAFWSVTMYDADRFLYPNAIGRHAIGDRTRGLVFEDDGSLILDISHERPQRDANWLPAPAGRFYLILRLYRPTEGTRQWRAPAVTRLSDTPQ